MTKYQVLARKYRPQRFAEVLGQEAIVTILKNAIAKERLAHAYLFAGPRGTGKTTLARLFAKAINCKQRTPEGEPCNSCSSCKEITGGNALDVLEIDGASHRGIDDIRQINETVGYSTASGGYKIYIIDEVHMLTKEAFNALLKTLEEPPPRVLFFFATTEPHKVLSTILSRCQRFNLNRIDSETIARKLGEIAKDLSVTIDPEALRMIAARAEGGLRDAESLFDQILSFHGTSITTEDVSAVLGIMPKECLFELDAAGKEGHFSFAFELAHRIFTEGKDLIHFVETLLEHFRNLLLIKLATKDAPFLTLTPEERGRYETSAKLYTKEQLLTLIDLLVQEQQQIRFAPSSRMALENILLRILRSFNRVPVEFLVRKLAELQEGGAADAPKMQEIKAPVPKPQEIKVPKAQEIRTLVPKPQEIKVPMAQEIKAQVPNPQEIKVPMAQEIKAPKAQEPKPVKPKMDSSLTEDPTPAPQEIPRQPAPVELGARPTPEAAAVSLKEKSRYDTLTQFAAVELDGNIKKG